MANPNHHIAVHGHFYQPPRENPWLGVIEAQPSAHPFRDWNERISRECYSALTRAHIYDSRRRITDLYNCFAHISFNMGPTLNCWLEKHHPELITRLQMGDRLHAEARGGHHGALAQPFYHLILPLADARDRHIQIAWGLREFRFRFGHAARGMWLPECAIDMNTIRALIDHGVRFVILSPFQASKIRPFGEEAWQDVSQGGPDPRRPYRVFEVDGAGRTHFDRYLDVIFFDRELSVKISFDHLLCRPDDMAGLIFSRFDQDASLPQLVTIATDGEIYGHHEPGGEESLARLLAHTAHEQGIYISNLEQYLAENPPTCEVKLWFGPDDKGSSWSCEHGVGRWFRDCGCQDGGHYRWNQAWRTPLRQALDHLRCEARGVFMRKGAALFVDPFEAMEDYVTVLLEPDSRDEFLIRHARKKLSEQERILAWEMLELCRNATMMYTSCGWFFADIGGIETVQNLCYALRAAELAQPHTSTDLLGSLCECLEDARSNVDQILTGADILRRDVMPARYTPQQVAASHILCRMLGVAEPEYALAVEVRTWITEESREQYMVCRGNLQVRDTRTMREHDYAFYAITDFADSTGVLFAEKSDAEAVKALSGLPPDRAGGMLKKDGVLLRHLPLQDRERIISRLTEKQQQDLDAAFHEIQNQAFPLLAMLARNGVPPPTLLRTCAEHTLEKRLLSLTRELADTGQAGPRQHEQARRILEEAAALRLQVDRFAATGVMSALLQERISALPHEVMPAALDQVLSLVDFCQNADLSAASSPLVREAFWHFLHGPALAVLTEAGDSLAEIIRGKLKDFGAALGFSGKLLEERLQC